MTHLLVTTLIYLIGGIIRDPYSVEASIHTPSSQRASSSSGIIKKNGLTPLLEIERKSFEWSASLDGQTGVASSFERSTFQLLGGRTLGFSPSDYTWHAEVIAEILFSKYPTFLGQPSLTLGLCRSVPSLWHRTTMNEPCHLKTRIWPLTVLTFGKPRTVSTLKVAKKGFHHDYPSGKILSCVEIPIEGGLLANVGDTAPSTQSTRSSKGDNGCLRFTWIQTKCTRKQLPMIVLVTEIAGRYRPSLAGTELPVPAWRKTLYCSTQRMIHTYVMWRFHRFVAKQYTIIYPKKRLIKKLGKTKHLCMGYDLL
mmetsp:Transcript_34440/g.83329  ORF Transcript_34440/g.83329 Transcript_34440/m.83329 type:complete len:310 (-) Transcript_34440:83-1012(-)